MRTKKIMLILMGVALVSTAFLAVSAQTASKTTTGSSDQMAKMIKRGSELVTFGGCSDCHTPKKMTAMGPVNDSTRLLSGAPADTKVPPIPDGVLGMGPDKWAALTNADFTTWAGPWGVSFTANLTPDNVTGSGAWTEAAFIKALRTGKHLGAGRDILPPMPWQEIGTLPDSDLKAIFAYLRSLKPVENMVPLPIPPGGGK